MQLTHYPVHFCNTSSWVLCIVNNYKSTYWYHSFLWVAGLAGVDYTNVINTVVSEAKQTSALKVNSYFEMWNECDVHEVHGGMHPNN